MRLDHLLDNCFTRFFTALPAEQAVDDTVLARAKANMERYFAFVGLFERMDETITRLSKILGVQLKLQQINVTPSNPCGPTDRLFNEKIHPFVAYDQLLYRHAQRLFWNLMD